MPEAGLEDEAMPVFGKDMDAGRLSPVSHTSHLMPTRSRRVYWVLREPTVHLKARDDDLDKGHHQPMHKAA